MVDIVETLPGIKRGDTLTLNWSLPLVFANAIATVAAQVNESSGNEVTDLTVTLVGDSDTHRTWRLSATASQTSGWPVRTLRFDIKHVAIDGKVIRSDTILLPVRKAETP